MNRYLENIIQATLTFGSSYQRTHTYNVAQPRSTDLDPLNLEPLSLLDSEERRTNR